VIDFVRLRVGCLFTVEIGSKCVIIFWASFVCVIRGGSPVRKYSPADNANPISCSVVVPTRSLSI